MGVIWCVAMSESATRKAFKLMMYGRHPVNIENLLTGDAELGTPDVAYSHGFVELKNLDGFPVRASTVVRIPHYTDNQRDWLLAHHRAGGLAWLVIQVEQEWFVFDAERAQEVGLTLTRQDWYNNANAHWGIKPTPWQMQDVLVPSWATPVLTPSSV